MPKINENYLKGISDEVYKKTKTLFDDLALDYKPTVKTIFNKNEKYKDKRWMIRFEALGVTEAAKLRF